MQQCGWFKDEYSLSWQVIPVNPPEMMKDPDHAKAEQMIQALFKMKKLDFEALQHAFSGWLDLAGGDHENYGGLFWANSIYSVSLTEITWILLKVSTKPAGDRHR